MSYSEPWLRKATQPLRHAKTPEAEREAATEVVHRFYRKAAEQTPPIKRMLDMGVPENAMLLEGSSRTTFENALRTRELLGEGARNIALVTSAFHMGRAVLWFEKAGFTVYPVRTDIRVLHESRAFWEWLPKPQALDESTIAIKEYLGRLQLKASSVYEQGGAS
mgnify:CR=1 FL=1